MSLLNNAAEFFTDLGESWQAFRQLRTVPEPEAQFKAAREADTRLDVHTKSEDAGVLGMFMSIQALGKSDGIPKRGTVAYSRWLDAIWKEEPILAGAVYSMVAKMQAMTWKVEGGRNNANQVSQMLSRTRYLSGNEWGGFIGTSAIDFYTQDNGVWWDVTRRGGQWGKMSDLATIDTRCCKMTGNPKRPMYYYSAATNQEIWYKPGMFIHFASMPLPNEVAHGMGYCATSRAARAAKLLMALHDYDAEKLSNLPPEGIASVTGMSDKEFRQAIAMWQAERKKNNSLTFPQVLWLVGNNPGAKVEISIQSFSAIPESFDRQTVVAQYVNTLALDFGVDTREFWAISTGALGTASEAEVQHLKARGKGGGEFITMVERSLNAELPEDVVFEFDTQDIEEDMVAANIAKAWIEAYLPLAFPKAGEAAIDIKTFKRLLADKQVLPEWVVGDERIAITSGEIHKEYLEDVIRFIWRAGRLSGAKLITMKGSSSSGWYGPPKGTHIGVGEKVGALGSMSRSQLEGLGYVPVFRGTGPGGLKVIRPSTEGQFGPGVYFYDTPGNAKVYAEAGGGVVTGFVHPDDVQIHDIPGTMFASAHRIIVLRDVSKFIRRGDISTEDTSVSGYGHAALEKWVAGVVDPALDVVMKEDELEPNISGHPIPDDEVDRGARVTRKAINAEMAVWRTIPELAPYVESV